jgi:hypothetical protein
MFYKTITQQKQDMEYNDREFMIFSVTELSKIDFNEVMEDSVETVRKSLDGTKTFVKWEGDTIPSSVQSLTTKEGPYTYDEIISILSTSEWTDPNPIMGI